LTKGTLLILKNIYLQNWNQSLMRSMMFMKSTSQTKLKPLN